MVQATQGHTGLVGGSGHLVLPRLGVRRVLPDGTKRIDCDAVVRRVKGEGLKKSSGFCASYTNRGSQVGPEA